MEAEALYNSVKSLVLEKNLRQACSLILKNANEEFNDIYLPLVFKDCFFVNDGSDACLLELCICCFHDRFQLVSSVFESGRSLDDIYFALASALPCLPYDIVDEFLRYSTLILCADDIGFHSITCLVTTLSKSKCLSGAEILQYSGRFLQEFGCTPFEVEFSGFRQTFTENLISKFGVHSWFAVPNAPDFLSRNSSPVVLLLCWHIFIEARCIVAPVSSQYALISFCQHFSVNQEKMCATFWFFFEVFEFLSLQMEYEESSMLELPHMVDVISLIISNATRTEDLLKRQRMAKSVFHLLRKEGVHLRLVSIHRLVKQFEGNDHIIGVLVSEMKEIAVSLRGRRCIHFPRVFLNSVTSISDGMSIYPKLHQHLSVVNLLLYLHISKAENIFSWKKSLTRNYLKQLEAALENCEKEVDSFFESNIDQKMLAVSILEESGLQVPHMEKEEKSQCLLNISLLKSRSRFLSEVLSGKS